MKTLQEIQEFNRRKIICGVNGTEDYEEALEELAEDKLLDSSDGPYGYGQWVKIRNDNIIHCYPDANDDFVENDYLMKVNKFASSLLTLDRVLIAIRQCGFNADLWFGKDGLFKDLSWDFTKPTLEEQSEETQRAIYELLGGVNE